MVKTQSNIYTGEDPFSTFAKFAEKLLFLTPDTRTCAYQRVRSVSFSENLANLLNK